MSTSSFHQIIKTSSEVILNFAPQKAQFSPNLKLDKVQNTRCSSRVATNTQIIHQSTYKLEQDKTISLILNLI